MTGYGAKTSKGKNFRRPKRRLATKQASNEWQCYVQKYQRRSFVHFVFRYTEGGKKALMHFRKLSNAASAVRVHFWVFLLRMLRV